MAFRTRASITVDQTAFQSAIGPAFAELRRDAADYSRERAHRIADIARAIAPRLKHPDPRFYPGELADSIDVTEVAPGEWDVGVWARWAWFVEAGTSKMAAQPYLRPAVAMVEAESR